ncbi:MAG: hypothetical protein ACXVUE_07210 [Solirubrobacteraceae bacterium]
MRAGPEVGILCVVSAQEPVRVVLEIQKAPQTISGQVSVEGAAASEFHGWAS